MGIPWDSTSYTVSPKEKLVRITEMCLNETITKVHVYKHLSDALPV
jgi:hypothetical protein